MRDSELVFGLVLQPFTRTLVLRDKALSYLLGLTFINYACRLHHPDFVVHVRTYVRAGDDCCRDSLFATSAFATYLLCIVLFIIPVVHGRAAECA
jgi:hypothetical protein